LSHLNKDYLLAYTADALRAGTDGSEQVYASLGRSLIISALSEWWHVLVCDGQVHRCSSDIQHQSKNEGGQTAGCAGWVAIFEVLPPVTSYF